jgi:hypothetical protein
VVEPNGSSRLQIVAQQQQTPMQRDVVRQLLPQAEECWWSPGHVGWALFDPEAMAPTAMQVSISEVINVSQQLCFRLPNKAGPLG